MLLPRKVGPFTLMRKVDADVMAESYVAILDAPAGKQVVARRLLSAVTRDPARMAQIRARVADLRSARHPALAGVLELVETDGEAYVLEDQVEGAELRRVIDHCAANGLQVPHNVYLEIAVQICNAIEALHARPGIESGSENVLHLALAPSAIWIGPDGKVTLGRYGLTRSPTALATQATGLVPSRVEYLAPEQTHQDQKLNPASDLFSLGAVLYELLALRPMFLADTHLQTIHRVRRAEVTTQLLEVKELLPGLDKVLFRSLSLNPRHRYQRAFVLREDLRGLMAGYSFSDIAEATRGFLEPVLATLPPEEDLFDQTLDTTFGDLVPMRESTQDLLGEVPDRASLSDSPMGGPRRVTDSLGDDGPFPDTGGLLEPDTSMRPEDGPGPTGWIPSSAGEEGYEAPARVPSLEVNGVLDALAAAAAADALRGDTLPMGMAPLDGPTHPSMDPEPEVPVARAAPPAPATTEEIAPPEPPAAPRSVPPEPTPPPPPEPAPPPPPRPVARAAPTPPRGAPPAPHLHEPPARRWPWAVAAVAGLSVAAALLVCVGGGGVLGLAALRPGATPEPVALAPTPTVALAEPPPAAVASPAPAPAPPPDPKVARALAPPRPAPPRETFQAVTAAAPAPAPTADDALADAALDDVPPLPVPVGDLDQWSEAAFAGRLDPSVRAALASVPPSDPAFTRAATLVFLDAKARRDTTTRDRVLAVLLAQPENAYNPELLVERALVATERKQWQAALADAKLAELHWARLPSDLVVSRKTLIYEIQAVANTGLFYESEGEDLPRLDAAIRGWERYRSHVASVPAPELVARADESLATLRDARERLE